MDNQTSNNLTPDAVDLLLSMFSDELEHHDNKEELLKDWCSRYPHLTNELIGITFGAPVYLGGTDDQTESQARLMSDILTKNFESVFLQNSLMPSFSYNYAKKNASLQPNSLETAFVNKGMDISRAAALLKLTNNMIKQLSDRKVDIITIPILLVDKIAGILECNVRDVLNLLSRRNLQPQASMVYEAKPQYNYSSDFSDLLQRSDASEEDKEYWAQAIKYSRFINEQELEDN